MDQPNNGGMPNVDEPLSQASFEYLYCLSRLLFWSSNTAAHGYYWATAKEATGNDISAQIVESINNTLPDLHRMY